MSARTRERRDDDLDINNALSLHDAAAGRVLPPTLVRHLKGSWTAVIPWFPM